MAYKELPIISFLLFFVEIVSKLENVGPVFSSFNPFPSLPSVSTNDRKQDKHHNIFLNNTPRPLFFEFSWGKTHLGFKKDAKINWHSPFKLRKNAKLLGNIIVKDLSLTPCTLFFPLDNIDLSRESVSQVLVFLLKIILQKKLLNLSFFQDNL